MKIIAAQNNAKKRNMIPPGEEFCEKNIQEKKEKNPIIIPHTIAVATNDFVIGILLIRYKMNMRILEFLLFIC
jgi:hypothetical protein